MTFQSFQENKERCCDRDSLEGLVLLLLNSPRHSYDLLRPKGILGLRYQTVGGPLEFGITKTKMDLKVELILTENVTFPDGHFDSSFLKVWGR